ncbi:hypothetical protein NS365_19555 [Aureimonas ureilytica]|uniref:Polygalacturonase n=1 Tax=Aureimonas ureilytica TaxID=401562 RepID=A0A175RHB1_9HYPH|nr:glycosyl hydrolase family 28 protein [Aureimonas ureilytica]KTR03140.1 hypothetical protein NS365_19555 [Aureimonas ureilytica]
MSRFASLSEYNALLRGGLLIVAALFAWNVQAQDRRDVREPSLPTQVCATLASKGDTDDTGRIQAAIDRCEPGAAVRLVAAANDGRFVSRPLHMASGVTLWIDRGVVLAATTDPLAYDRGQGTCGTIATKGDGCAPFLSFSHTQGGGIVGDGTIDGQGGAVMAGHRETWWQLARRAQNEGGHQNNPRLIELEQARNVTFYRVTLRNAANFHVALNKVEGATFWGVRIDTPADARNTDGIDPGASQDVTIAHSFIRTGDDNIAIKAGKGATRFVSILNDHFYWGHGLSIGSEVNEGVSDILVRDVTLDGTTSGLRIKSDASRGGLVTRVRYDGVCLRGNRKPIDFDTRYDPGVGGQHIPVYRDILLHDVSGTDGALILRGYDGAHPLHVTLNGVHFASDATWNIDNAQLSAGPGGVSPIPAGYDLSPARGPSRNCDASWVPFPTDHTKAH